jgi:hypothetical protein
MSQGFMKGLSYLSTRDCRLMIRAYCALCYLYATRYCVLHGWLYLLRLLILAFSLSLFFLSPAALIADVVRNVILRVLLYLHLLGWLRCCQLLI